MGRSEKGPIVTFVTHYKQNSAIMSTSAMNYITNLGLHVGGGQDGSKKEKTSTGGVAAVLFLLLRR